MATSTTDEWKDVPQTLYHYCNAEGLKGIVENKCLWMSNVACMNDYMEHNWLLELARECLRLRMRRSVLNLLDSPDQFYEELETLVFSQPTSTPYVVSFSAGGDILSQWRAYSDDGLGFAVGFDPRLFGVPPCILRTPYCTLPTITRPTSVYRRCSTKRRCRYPISTSRLPSATITRHRQQANAHGNAMTSFCGRLWFLRILRFRKRGNGE